MDLRIIPTRLEGTVRPPSSKSQAHRLILAAALSGGRSRLETVSMSEDIQATIRCMEALGARFSWEEDGSLTVQGLFSGENGPSFQTLPHFDCGESGSTLRFLIPVALAVAGGGVFTGRGRLMERPQEPYARLFAEKGVTWECRGGVLTVRGRLEPGIYRLPGNVSSQFFTGLFYALPLLKGPSQVVSTTAMESVGYLDMTREVLQWSGIQVESQGSSFAVPGNCCFAPLSRAVEGDWSQAAFYCVANGIGNRVRIEGMQEQSTQGDRVIAAYSRRLADGGAVTVDVSQCPDLVPALALQAALRDGEITEIVGAARLRIKESDRLSAVAGELGKLGARIEEQPESLRITGVAGLHGGEVDSRNDHRIAMTLAMAATRAHEPVLLRDAGSVAKSYPDFWRDYQALGGRIEEV